MLTKQTISIIGATGNMGKALAKSLAKGNYRLLLFARDLIKVKALADDILTDNPNADIEAIDCSVNACWEADIIILAIPYNAEQEIAKKIKDVTCQKIVVSISNPINDLFNGLVTAANTSAAEELQKMLPNSKVVKAFNTTFAADFHTPVIDGKTVDSFIASDDEESLQTIVEMVEVAGFHPIIAGNLSVSRTLESMQLLLIQLTIKNNQDLLAGWKILRQ